MAVGYVIHPDAAVRLRGGSLLVTRNGATIASWELEFLDALCLFGPARISTRAMRALLTRGIPTALLTGRGRLVGSLLPPAGGNASLRLAQYRLTTDLHRRLTLSRSLIDAKMANAAAVLRRFMRNHPDVDLANALHVIEDFRARLPQAQDLAALRGLEGSAARTWFTAMQRMCVGELPLKGRTRRPPRDPVNALLSLAYTFLTTEITSSLAALGFDPYLGFYHDVARNRPSLALDLAEPLRQGIIDRIVLSVVNKRVLTPDDFHHRPDGACYLTRDALKRFIREYERNILRYREDPLTGRRETYRRHIWLQTERLAATLLRNQAPAWFRLGD